MPRWLLAASCLLLLLAQHALAQQNSNLAVAIEYPCARAGEFFDIATLQCQRCDAVRVAAVGGGVLCL